MSRTTFAAVLLAGRVTAALIVTGFAVAQGTRAPAPSQTVQAPPPASSDRG